MKILAWSKMAILTSLELLNKFSRSLDFWLYPAQGMIVVFVIIAKANFWICTHRFTTIEISSTSWVFVREGLFFNKSLSKCTLFSWRNVIVVCFLLVTIIGFRWLILGLFSILELGLSLMIIDFFWSFCHSGSVWGSIA